MSRALHQESVKESCAQLAKPLQNPHASHQESVKESHARGSTWPAHSGKVAAQQSSAAAAATIKAAAEMLPPEASSPARQGSSSVCSEVTFIPLKSACFKLLS